MQEGLGIYTVELYLRVRLACSEGMSFDEAAALPFGFTTARHFLFRKGGLASGERLLVNGASGAVGVAMVQLAKARGAHVTGVCSGANAALVFGLGADEVIDYTRTDFRVADKRWDVIADNIGNIPPAEAEANFYAALETEAMAASLNQISLRRTRRGSIRGT